MASLLVEYAKSGRSRCKGCKQSIGQDEVRVGKEADYGDWTQASWYHLGCIPKGKMRSTAATAYQGYKLLKKKDQNALKEALKGSDPSPDPAPKPSKRAAAAAPKPTKKAKTAPGQNWKGYTPAQYTRFKELKEELADKTSEQLKALCKANGQKVTGTKDELVERVADGMLLGAVPKCGACGGGRLRFDAKTGVYSCPGYMEDDDFIRCNTTFSLSEVTRTPWESS